MFPPTALVVAFLCLSPAYALDLVVHPITIADKVTANVPAQATLNVKAYNYETTWCNAFRVYLASAPEKQNTLFFRSECTLIYDQTLCDPTIELADNHIGFHNTTFNVTIPPSVGPSGNFYALIAQILKTDGSYYSGGLESNLFAVTGATGNWSTHQLDGYTLWGADGIPCGGFACVKNCSDAAKEAYKPGQSLSNGTYESCANSCPSVSIDWKSTYGGQPTASLTRPSPCAIQSWSSNTAQVTGSTSTASQSRNAAATATAATGTASHNLGIHYDPVLLLLPILGFAILG